MKHHSAPHDRPARFVTLATRLVPVGMIAVCAVFMGSDDVRPLKAESLDGDGYDTDGDGLPDRLELDVLKTSPTSADSDGDGYDDGIEFARSSSPLDATQVPGGDLSVAVGAHSTIGEIHLVTAVYAPDGVFANKSLGFRMLIDGRGVRIQPQNMHNVRIEEHGNLRVIDWIIPAARIQRLDHVTFAADFGHARELHSAAAAVLDLRMSDQVVILTRTDAARRESGGAFNNQGMSSGSSTGGGGGQSTPLPTGGARGGPGSGEWTPGAICEMETATVGTGPGGMLEQEVISAECVDGFDSFCDSGCANQVGRTLVTIDPVVLIGG